MKVKILVTSLVFLGISFYFSSRVNDSDEITSSGNFDTYDSNVKKPSLSNDKSVLDTDKNSNENLEAYVTEEKAIPITPSVLSIKEDRLRRINERLKQVESNSEYILTKSLQEGEDAVLQLKGYLSLDDNEAKKLETALVRKIESDLEVNKTKATNEIDRNHLDYLYEKNRLEFELEVSKFLTNDQIEQYTRFEQEKVERRIFNQGQLKAASLIEILPSLTEYQRNEIYNIYSATNAFRSKINIGTFGTPRDNKYEIWVAGSEDAPLYNLNNIEDILDTEQLEVFRERNSVKQ